MKKLFAAAGAGSLALSLAGFSAPAGAAAAPHSDPSSPFNAGYSVGEATNNIAASWTEPRITVHGYHDSHATILIGYLDINDGNIIFDPAMPQIGTNADSIGGVPRYYAWYSGLTESDGNHYRHRLSNSVRPGDRISTLITMRGGMDSPDEHFTLKLTDVRYRKHRPPVKWTFVKHISGAGAMGVAVSVTKPDQRLLSDFGTVHFTGVKLNGAVIGSFYPNVLQVDWVDSYGNTVAKTSHLGRLGDSFSVVWKRGK